MLNTGCNPVKGLRWAVAERNELGEGPKGWREERERVRERERESTSRERGGTREEKEWKEEREGGCNVATSQRVGNKSTRNRQRVGTITGS